MIYNVNNKARYFITSESLKRAVTETKEYVSVKQKDENKQNLKKSA